VQPGGRILAKDGGGSTDSLDAASLRVARAPTAQRRSAPPYVRRRYFRATGSCPPCVAVGGRRAIVKVLAIQLNFVPH